MGARRSTGIFAIAFAALAASLAASAGPAAAARRVALVIGNGDYARFADLRNPGNDARAMAARLQSLGFRLVGGKAHVDVTRRRMAGLLAELEDQLSAPASGPESGPAATVLVYYSGHGVAEAGSNWLVPVDDGSIRYREDVPDFAIGARSVMRRLQGRAGGLNILILDACRNNPLPSRRRTKGAGSKGLARMAAPSNTVVVYAAAPGRVAYDGSGTLSPFTGALIEEMGRPGKRLIDVLGATAAAVERRTAGMPQGKQEPWLEMKPLQRPFYFLPGKTAGLAAPKPPQGGAGASRDQLAARAYEAAERLNTVEAYEAVARRFAGTIYAELAHGQIRKLKGAGTQADPAEAVEAALGLTVRDRRAIQSGLAAAGFNAGPADGVFGPATRLALKAWQKKAGQAATGRLTAASASTLKALGRQAMAGAATTAGKTFRDCAGCPVMVAVPAGSFTMGSPSHEAGRKKWEGPQHRVTIRQPFAVGKYEVTRAEFARFVAATGHATGNSCWTWEDGDVKERSDRGWRNPGFGQSGRDPVTCVSWHDAQQYVRWLSNRTGKRYRLLSESEWEYAARAGTTTARYWGDDTSAQCGYANGADGVFKERYSDWKWGNASCRDGSVHTSPVGRYRANRFGLHDLLGNVWEWVEDCGHKSYRGAPSDGNAWTAGGNCGRRVLRGGSWYSFPGILRAAVRFRLTAGFRINYIGFRVARTLSP